MSSTEVATFSSVVAVYPDRSGAERAVRQLHDAGFDLGDLSIVGRDLKETEKPCGLVNRGDYVQTGAKTGSFFGGMLGLCIGAAFLVLPGLGPIVVAGPLAAALLAGIEGALAGTALGSLAGGARRLGCSEGPGDQIRESMSREASFSSSSGPVPEVVARARSLLAAQGPDHIDLYEPPAS